MKRGEFGTGLGWPGAPTKLLWSVVALGFVITSWLLVVMVLSMLAGLIVGGVWLEREIDAGVTLGMRTADSELFETVGEGLFAFIFAAGAWCAAREAPHAPRLHAVAVSIFSLIALNFLLSSDPGSELWQWSSMLTVVLSLAAGEQVRRSVARQASSTPTHMDVLPGGVSRPAPLRALFDNLRAGCAVACFRPVPIHSFRVSGDQVVLLALLNLGVGFGWEWLLTEPPRVFTSEGLAVHGFWLLATLLLAYLASRELSSGVGVARIAVMLLSPLFVGWLGFALLKLADRHSELVANILADLYYGQIFAFWLLMVYGHVLKSVVGLPSLRACALAATYCAAMVFAFGQLPSAYLWYTDTPPPPAREAPTIDVEGVLHGQNARVRAALAELLPDRPGVVDLYFLGFAADATEDVFATEVRFIRELLDRRFDTAGRSLLLVNHDDTLDSGPLASASNLADALAGLAGVMDPREDVLLLYLTGHGSRDHELRVKFPGLPLNPVDPDRLAAMLDTAGIGWPMVVVSACYSGGYVDPLRGEQSLVLTAAAADRVSFGCGNKSEFTYFARAYFEEQLEHTHDLVAAFDAARVSLTAREESEERKPSRPQIALGDAMARRLERLSARLDAIEVTALGRR